MTGLLDTALKLLGFTDDSSSASSPTSDNRPPTSGAGSRLTSANDARRLLQACLQEDAPRALFRAIVKGCCDGNPPYPEKPAGRKWEANLNFMKGRGIMKRTAVPYYNLFARVDYFADCRTAYQEENPDHEHWSTEISQAFHNLLKRWKPGFNFNVQQISYWMRLHGIGFALRDKDYDWRFRAIETGNILVPQSSPSCLDDRIPYLFIRMPYRILELYEKIQDEKTAKDAGWNVEAVRNAIKYGMRGMIGPNATDWYSRPWEDFQRILSNSQLTASFTDGDMVHCAIMLMQEPGGKISKFIFTESEVAPEAARSGSAAAAATARPASDFLFTKPNCYDSYLDTLVPFFRDTGDGTWHSVRGYAMEAFRHVEVENRLLCRGLDFAFVKNSVILKYQNERARTLGQTVQVNGVIIQLPTGTEWQQVPIQGSIEEIAMMQRLLGNHLDNNLGVGAPRSISREDGRGEMPTARQVDYTAANEASIGEGEITIFYEQLDSLYSMIFAAAADPSTSDEEAKRFQKECKDAGVPKEALANMEYVRANRQNGYGSPEMGMMKFNQSKDLVPMLPEDGKHNWLDDAITSIHGPEKTLRYNPPQHIPDGDDWQAQVENEMFRGGVTPVINSGQNDVAHLTSHIADAQEFLGPMAQALESGAPADPVETQKALTYVQAAAPNIEAHLQRLQGDPTRRGQAQLFNDQFQAIISFSGKLFVAFRRAQRQARIEQEQAAQSTALSALDQAKVDSVRTSTALAAQKTQSQMENQRAKTVQSMALKEAKTRQDFRIDARKSIEIPAEVVR